MLAVTAVVTTIVVGLVEVAPNRCQVDLLNPDGTTHRFETICDHIVADYELPTTP